MTAGWFGATPAARGFRFHLWAPEAREVTLHVRRDARRATSYQLSAASFPPDASRWQPDAGCWELLVEEAQAGDRYAYSVDGRDPLPDPASRFQPDGVHSWSELIDPLAFQWTDGDWPGLDPRRAVIYELHVGTFTPEGTFRAAAGKLPYLRDLGVTAIELMPVADFAGSRNWGYDGVALFAPAHAYGRPDDLRALVDAAHQHGLAVLIDVVYNHLGPEGAYLPAFSPPFLTPAHQTPWGSAVNLDGPGSRVVRRLLTDNVLHWLREYHADGLRFDATHSLIDTSVPHFVAEAAASLHEASDGRALAYAEDYRNLAAMLDSVSHGGWGLDGVWADDFHHVIRRMLTGDSHGYYRDFAGAASELAVIFRHGWLFTGQRSEHLQQRRGTDGTRVPLRKAVICIQNHDQIGNRALGDRLNHVADAASWRAASALLLTAPMTPLIFMGQEWAASTPFAFFTDFEPALGRLVDQGRRREFAAFPEFAGPAAERIPGPQAETTFQASKLRWDEQTRGDCARALALTRRLLRLRAAEPSLAGSDACVCEAEPIAEDTLAFVRRGRDGRAHLVVARLRGHGAVVPQALRGRPWQKLLDTEDAEFACDPQPPAIDTSAGLIEFRRPGAVIFTT